MNLEEINHYLHLGGPTLLILLAASLLAFTVTIERIISLWGLSDHARGLAQTVTKHLLRGDWSAARSVAERSKSPAADIFLAGFDRTDRQRVPPAALAATVDRERSQVNLRLRKNLWVLGTIGATAPFVGLFGTVAGIMRSFRDLGIDVQGGGLGGPSAVMTGISEALVTTAVGILVAVQAVILYNYFQARLARASVELRLLAEEFVELLKEPITSTPSPSPDSSSSSSSLGEARVLESA